MRQFNCEDNATYTPGQKKITPTGTIEITENGTYDVAQYANADVNVSGGGGGGGDDSFGKFIDGSIESITIPSSSSTVNMYACAYRTSLKSVVIENGPTNIGNSAFMACVGLLSIDIARSVSSIGRSSFDSCVSLQNITVRATTPPAIQSNTFQGVPSNANIYVPAESVEAYKTATNWSSRAAYIQAISE